MCRFPPVTIRRLNHQPLDNFSPNRGRVGTPLVESSLSMMFPMADAEVSAVENKGEGSIHEGLGN